MTPRQIGIRAALGASRQEIVGLVLRQGMRLAAIGMAGGVLAAVALPLGGIALLACYIPARRATAVDPVVAVRCE